MPHPISRRALLRATTASAALAGMAPLAPLHAAPRAAPAAAPLTHNRAPLAPQPFQPLPTGAIRPAGWLRRQLEIQARGMGGRLDETWPDVGANSGWLGGTGESWERGPYFLDGLLPLAWQLDDAALKAKAQRFVEWTLASQRPDGMFGPASNDDWWPRMVMLKALTQYHELTGDPRVLRLMSAYFAHQLKALPARPLKDWGKFRWQDQVVSVVWLYNRTGDAGLLELAALLKRQGYDWQGLFADYPYRTKTSKRAIGLDRPDVPGEVPEGLRDPALSVHGVNNAQALKASPVWSVVSGDAADRAAIRRQLGALDRYHGLPIGIYSADEHLAGRSPSQGVELCAIVEAMYSLEQALAITGDPALADRIERLAYNALPATFTDDMWAHQYDQQPNQVRCVHGPGPWTTNGPESNMFGLEPHFGCCTANFHQGWPKLTTHLWMASADGGLAATLYAPCTVETRVGDVPVALRQETDYPFRHTVAITLEPERPVAFPLRLRVPGWAERATVTVNGQEQPAKAAQGFVRLDRTWRRGDRVELAFASLPRAVRSAEGWTSFEDGALVFALPVEERWSTLRPRGLTADYEVRPASDWAVAVAPGAAIERVERAVGPVPFSRRSPAVVLTTTAYPVSGWAIVDGAAAPPPESPTVSGAARPVTLMPYAAPKLRVTAFPTMAIPTAQT
ncbi:glycoside hydrolase family 127 protein [Sphingomonas sp. RHCKR7]|uniref:beta-L-arabinofuranosidase domain-containing protein n=1 Tax=Sphingomonas folli TaxID=2862497 RepID=UPI001C66EBB0|nr:beta-L-arabinofuranosidase domain-containing protein [Sphingomonas folli]MBW6527000.1 glycoside hydrolase family 127 protein [Sphingomonas folli]